MMAYTRVCRMRWMAPGHVVLSSILLLFSAPWLKGAEKPKNLDLAQPASPAQQSIAAGPWQINVLSFGIRPSISTNVQGNSVRLSPSAPANCIAIVKVKGSAKRGFTAEEQASIMNVLGDTAKFAAMLQRAYRSPVFLFHQAFALAELGTPAHASASPCQLMLWGGGPASTTFNKDGTPATCLGFLQGGEFTATLFFACRSQQRGLLLLFMPAGKATDPGAALIDLGDPKGPSVRYGTVEELAKVAQLIKERGTDEASRKEEPTKQPPPEPAKPVPQPVTPEEAAKRLWDFANNMLLNKATAQAKAKLREIVEKYPTSSYASRASAKLREIE